MAALDVDFRQIRSQAGSEQEGFEEFCCQLARRDKDVPAGSVFSRYRGAGGDGGVECVWQRPGGQEDGWQAKYLFDLNKAQLDQSVATALELHPRLARYTICLPFDLTGPKAGRGGRPVKSQSERYAEFQQGWADIAEGRGMTVQFVLWTKSYLLDALLEIDSTRGRLRYWFDVEWLSDDWFIRQVREAASAEPRYTPRLSVDVPISQAFEALGRTPEWEAATQILVQRSSQAADDWEQAYLTKSGAWGTDVEFPDAKRAIAARLTSKLREVAERLRAHSFAHGPASTGQELAQLVQDSLGDAEDCLDAVTAAFEEKHGSGKLESENWRQFMADYEGSFPGLHVDSARKVLEALKEIHTWLGGLPGQLPNAPGLLVTGATGVGKTHAICDAALDRAHRGLRSLVLLGQWFKDGDPWPQVQTLLGLPGDLSRQAVLGALEAAGEASGYPVIVFIDGLNETEPRSMWHTHLMRVLNEIRHCKWVRLCVSCRSTFEEDVIASNVDAQIYKIEHMGFEGVEFDAFREFFAFYLIELPSMPLLQPEFSNPLFLKLVCESVRDAGLTRLPEGSLGITAILEWLLVAKNARLARELDYDPRDQIVDRAVGAVTEAMARSGELELLWEDAKSMVEAIRPTTSWSNSLFNALLRENVLSEARTPGTLQGQLRSTVRFAFQRMAEHLIARQLLLTLIEPVTRAFEPGGALHFTVASSAAMQQHRGLLEAVGIQLPEKFGVELPAAAPDSPDRSALLNAVLGGLMWRTSESIGPQTLSILTTALHATRYRDRAQALEAVLSVGTRVACAANAAWLHDQLRSFSLPERDEFWCPFLHLSYGARKSVDRLICWALHPMSGSYTPDVDLLWLTTLGWFCAAADRRVRDHATMAMVHVLERHPSACEHLLRWMGQVDDDYIVERCLAASYGALIRNQDLAAIQSTADVLVQWFADDRLPQNAMIRDYTRLIMELAAFHGVLPAGTTIDEMRPPYQTEWPPIWPDSETVDQYKDSGHNLPKLYFSCMFDDFARYTIESALGNYEGLDLDAARRWIFQQVLDIGYTERFRLYDGMMLATYGGGRSKPSWAERVGKKYQWIALDRLVARVADHIPRERAPWSSPAPSSPELQVLMERDLDPTVTVPTSLREDRPSWWATAEYSYEPWANVDDETWLRGNDWPDSSAMLEAEESAGGVRWLVLNVSRTWASDSKTRDGQPRRFTWLHLRSYFVQKDQAERCWRWLTRQQLLGESEPDRLDFRVGFVGEYPWALPFAHAIEEILYYRTEETPRFGSYPVASTSAWLGPEHKFDCYHEGIARTVPAPEFFDSRNLEWDGISGYRNKNGLQVFLDPSVVTPGPSALLVKRDFLEDYLETQELALIWTAVAEKQFPHVSPAALQPIGRTRTHLLLNGKVRHSRGITGPRRS